MRLPLASIPLLGLAACVDIDMDVTALGRDRVVATIQTTMTDSAFTVFAARPGGPAELATLCSDGLPERVGVDSMRCSVTLEGSALTLPALSGDRPVVAFSPDPGGKDRVRVALSTAELATEIASWAGGIDNPETRAIAETLFAGRSLTLAIGGGTVHSTNMVRAGEGVTITIPLDDLIVGSPALPRTYYVTLDLPDSP